MSTFKNIEEARAYFAGDKFATENGMTLDEIGESSAVCSMTLTGRHKNANGGIMGGAIFTLADFAFAVAVNNVHRPTVAQQVSINYLSGAKGTRLTAECGIVKDGRNSIVTEVMVKDDTGRDIARMTVTSFKLYR